MGKKGTWSNKEKQFVRDHADAMTAEQIGREMGRDPETVRAFIRDHVSVLGARGAPEKKVRQAIRDGLRQSRAWKKLKDEFTGEELLYFEEEWVALVAQFQDDVLATEEQQVRKAITMDILMRRNLSLRTRALEDIERLERQQRRAQLDFERDREGLSASERHARERTLLQIEEQLQLARINEQSKTREYLDLEKEHQKLMKDLKATRDQRISRVESSKESFLGVIRDLEKQDRREAEGRRAKLMERAVQKEWERLAAPHRYEDGKLDRPLLTADTLSLGDAPSSTSTGPESSSP